MLAFPAPSLAPMWALTLTFRARLNAVLALGVSLPVTVVVPAEASRPEPLPTVTGLPLRLS